MPEKRGRPLFSNVEDLDVLRRREAWRRQQRDRRNRQRTHTATKKPTQKQLQQGEQIINFVITDEEDAAQTSTELGLRVQDVTLAQNFEDSLRQRHAVPCDEHAILCQTGEPAHATTSECQPVPLEGLSWQFMANVAVQPVVSCDKQSSSEFFHPMPTKNASSPNLAQCRINDRSVSNTSRKSQHSPSSSSRSSAVFMPDDNFVAGLLDTENTAAQVAPIQDGDGILDAHEVVEERLEYGVQTGDDETVHSLAPEHSTHSEGKDPDQQLSALEHMTEKLYDQLISGFHGCSQQQHDEKLRKHMEAAGDNHYGLDEIFNDASFPSVLGLSNMISPEQLARYEPPSQAQGKRCSVERLRDTACLGTSACIEKRPRPFQLA